MDYLDWLCPTLWHKPGRTNPADGFSRMQLPVTSGRDTTGIHLWEAWTSVGVPGVSPLWDHSCAEVSSSLAPVQRVRAFCLEASAWTSGPVLCALCRSRACLQRRFIELPMPRGQPEQPGTASGPLAGTAIRLQYAPPWKGYCWFRAGTVTW